MEYIEKHQIVNEMLIKVGLRINGNLLFGSNQRCVAMLIVFKSIMDDISQELHNNQQQQSHEQQAVASSKTTSSRVPVSSIAGGPLNKLQRHIGIALDFLDFCRPLSVSMTNASKLLKEEILKLNQAHTDETIAQLRLDSSTTTSGASQSKSKDEFNTSTSSSSHVVVDDQFSVYESQKKQLKEFIDRFIDEEIWSSQKAICENILSNITTNDVILVYGCSAIVQNILLYAKSRGRSFRVIVVDSTPHFNGCRMTSFLNDNSIDVSYTLINSLSFVIRQATKVLLGANSILANGYVMSHIGTSQVALMAKASNVPTLVCCETYKLSHRVHVDSFGCNEVDSGHDLDSALNLRYDLTPPEFISMVINEKSSVPANSVPALLRFRAEKTRLASQLVA